MITANPFTSGAAKWNILAAYGAQRKLGKTDKQGQAYVQKLFRERGRPGQVRPRRDERVPLREGRRAPHIRERGARSRARTAQDIQFTIPKQTMLIEAPIAVLKTSENRDKANQFIRFTKSDTAQRIWAEWGFRPVSKKIYRRVSRRSSRRARRSTAISDPIFGGWAAADKKWFDPKGSIMVDIEKSIGGPTG